VIYRVPPNFPGSGRRVYPGFLQHTGFVAMNPDRHFKSHLDYFNDLVKGNDFSADAHRKFYDEYNAVLDMDADYYLETIQTVFQDFSLVKGTWDVRNVHGQIERVKPQDIKGVGLLTVEGELDDISGLGQTRAAHGLCKGIPESDKTHLEVKGAGHYGIFSGRRWRETVYPTVKAFLAKRQPLAKKHLFVAEPSMMSDDHSGAGHAQVMVAKRAKAAQSAKATKAAKTSKPASRSARKTVAAKGKTAARKSR